MALRDAASCQVLRPLRRFIDDLRLAEVETRNIDVVSSVAANVTGMAKLHLGNEGVQDMRLLARENPNE